MVDTLPGPTWIEEGPNLVLLILLYMLQGLPLGLSTGSLSILLSSSSTLTKIGLFSMSSYPYSLKLLYAPIIDSVYPKGKNSPGRRRTWIIPLQLLLGALLWVSASTAQRWVEQGDVQRLTYLFFGLVFLAASQDVAVDGWALTMLHPKNLAFASTCQTIGMNLGYSLSFPIFLALNDPAFSDRVRGFLFLPPTPGVPLWDLATFMRLSGALFIAVTAAVLLKREPLEAPDLKRRSPSAWAEVREAYGQLWSVVKLKATHRLALLLLTFRLWTSLSEGMLSLKLTEKGVGQDQLAAMVLVQTPLEFGVAILAGSWARSAGFAQPWSHGWVLRLLTCLGIFALVHSWPLAGASSPWFLALQAIGGALSFASTVQFTAQGAFFAKIADPAIGGAYLTLLNTISNLGSQAYRPFLYALVDRTTQKQCVDAKGSGALIGSLIEQASCARPGHGACKKAGGICLAPPSKDGFFLCGGTLLAFSFLLMPFYFRLVRALEQLPEDKWAVIKTRARSREQAAAKITSKAKKSVEVVTKSAGKAAAASIELEPRRTRRSAAARDGNGFEIPAGQRSRSTTKNRGGGAPALPGNGSGGGGDRRRLSLSPGPRSHSKRRQSRTKLQKNDE